MNKISIVVMGTLGGLSGVFSGAAFTANPAWLAFFTVLGSAIAIGLDVRSQRKNAAEVAAADARAEATRLRIKAALQAMDERHEAYRAESEVWRARLAARRAEVYTCQIEINRLDVQPMTPAHEKSIRLQFDMAARQAIDNLKQ